MKEKETCWLRRAVSPLHHKATKKKVLMGTWRFTTECTRLQDLAVRSIAVLNSAPNGYELVGIQQKRTADQEILNRISMKLASKLNGTLEVQSPLFELVTAFKGYKGLAYSPRIGKLSLRLRGGSQVCWTGLLDNGVVSLVEAVLK
eukprot:1159374-Pelagomonas_calceolata.AAC.1